MAAKYARPLQGNIFQRFLATKFLAMPAIIMLIGFLVNVTALTVPFWFTVKSVSTNRQGVVSTSADSMGMFLYLKNGSHSSFDELGLKELNRVQKATNAILVPDTLKVAQILWLLGTMVSGATCAGLFLIAISPYLHLVAEIGLGAALTGGGLSLVLSIILSFASLGYPCDADHNWCNNMWRNTTVSLEAINWGFIVAIMGAVMMVVSAVMVWMQFMRTLRTVEYIRSQPYHPLDEEPVYVKYDYRKTVRPRDEYGPAPPMVTLPQMHDDQDGFPGVIVSKPAYDQGYDGRPSPRGQRGPPSYEKEYSSRQSPRVHRQPSYTDEPSHGYHGEPSPRSLKSPHSYGGSQEVSF